MEIITILAIFLSIMIDIYFLFRIIFFNKVRKSPKDYYAVSNKLPKIFLGNMPMSPVRLKFVIRGSENGDAIIKDDSKIKKSADVAFIAYLVGFFVFAFSIVSLLLFSI